MAEAANKSEDRAGDKLECGKALSIVGGVLWVAAFLVIFFLPAGLRHGHREGFLIMIAALFGVGLVLIIGGRVMRRQLQEE
jgi:formate/nitrite transporter FocA (FNT family)